MSSQSIDAAPVQPMHTVTREVYGRSILKRALLGIFLLFIMVSGGAWLMHAGIEAEADDRRGAEVTLNR